METITDEPKIAENQIGIDFDAIPDEQEKAQTFSEQDYKWMESDTLVVVVKAKVGAPVCWYDSVICGRPFLDWVAMAGTGCEIMAIDDCENIAQSLKTVETEKEFIVVLYSDTPLLTKDVLMKVMDYFVRNRLNVMTLPRGYVVRTEFLKNIETFSTTVLERFDDRAFARINDSMGFFFAQNIIRDRIFDYHEANGVIFENKNFIVIGADVEIESGVIIKKANVLAGESIIGRDTILNEGNVIVNSVIGPRCNLLGCHVFDSKIGQGQKFEGESFVKARIFGKI